MILHFKGTNMKRQHTSERPSVFDTYLDEIKKYMSMGLTMGAIIKIINHDMPIPASYAGLRSYCVRKGLVKDKKQNRVK